MRIDITYANIFTETVWETLVLVPTVINISNRFFTHPQTPHPSWLYFCFRFAVFVALYPFLRKFNAWKRNATTEIFCRYSRQRNHTAINSQGMFLLIRERTIRCQPFSSVPFVSQMKTDALNTSRPAIFL